MAQGAGETKSVPSAITARGGFLHLSQPFPRSLEIESSFDIIRMQSDQRLENAKARAITFRRRAGFALRLQDARRHKMRRADILPRLRVCGIARSEILHDFLRAVAVMQRRR